MYSLVRFACAIVGNASGVCSFRTKDVSNLLYCNLREIMDLIKIGGFQVGTQVLDYVSNKLDIFLIGRFWHGTVRRI